MSYNCHINKIRVSVQFRLFSKHYPRFFVNGVKVIFNKDLCYACNDNVGEDMIHFLLICPKYKNLREKLIGKYINNRNNATDNLISLLDIKSLEMLNNVYIYIIQSLKLRSKI